MKAGIFIGYKVLWVTKMATHGKYEAPFALETGEDHSIRSNIVPMQAFTFFPPRKSLINLQNFVNKVQSFSDVQKRIFVGDLCLHRK